MVKIRGYIDSNLILQIKKRYPDIEKLNTSALIDWMARKLLIMGEA